MKAQRSRVRIERGSKRVRTYLGGEVVADTATPLLVWEKPYYPVYYFPQSDVRMDLLTATGDTKTLTQPGRGNLVHSGDQGAESRGRRLPPSRISGRGAAGSRGLSLGRRWIRGSRKTKRFTSMPAILSHESTSLPVHATSRSWSVERRSPTLAQGRFPLRDRAADQVLPPQDGCPHGSCSKPPTSIPSAPTRG